MPIEPDTKDWTWVLDRPCDECGFVAAEVVAASLPDAIRDNAAVWAAVLADPDSDAAVRPAANIWSPLEYACHVRDVHTVFAGRVESMVDQDEPEFANWDQDETAIVERYAEQNPASVGPELVAAAGDVADRYAALGDADWGRRGLRSDGSEFTVESLGRYHLHDIVHHLHDVGAGRR